MSLKKLLEKKSEVLWQENIPHISIDCAVFGFHESSLKVLLTKLKDQPLWSLPGGYMSKEEDLKEAAGRILNERTGAEDIYLQQFKVFAKVNRSEGFFEEFDNSLWHKQRFISIGFYALVAYTDVVPVVDEFSDGCEWVDINALPEMMMDHREIFDKALVTLRRQLNYKPIGDKLLPEEFTMPELQKLYEIILDKKLNRGNFYRKMIGYDILDKLDEPRKGGAHKAPNLYKFNAEKYTTALKNGLKEGW
ncbi:NUDIX hydrolase [Flavobacterium subsaxonicum]|uniref:NUDIX hydrolase n=1 Tax=Flavobacterium subsaxonicum WB 4.1-42 = DSM 21790 TaxID=1121898 RepID=A0A0A2ML24_9FLAO|nr:NUDIX domain-containing protein [Flavobacterium subsaxonicum]KGO92266.1 NUDIX hydrolase [Flavobacterium subsaxonicum WB 4.1-42 = DSM 21790]